MHFQICCFALPLQTSLWAFALTCNTAGGPCWWSLLRTPHVLEGTHCPGHSQQTQLSLLCSHGCLTLSISLNPVPKAYFWISDAQLWLSDSLHGVLLLTRGPVLLGLTFPRWEVQPSPTPRPPLPHVHISSSSRKEGFSRDPREHPQHIVHATTLWMISRLKHLTESKHRAFYRKSPIRTVY